MSPQSDHPQSVDQFKVLPQGGPRLGLWRQWPTRLALADQRGPNIMLETTTAPQWSE